MLGYFNLNLMSALEKKQRDSWHYNNYSPWSADYAGQFTRDGYNKIGTDSNHNVKNQTNCNVFRKRLLLKTPMSSVTGCYLNPDIKRLYVA